MNKYVVDLASAFMKVRRENFNWNALNIHGADYEQEAENNFSSEIVRYFRNLMEKPRNIEYYRGLSCHFDVRKARLNIQPDIVLHESPDNQLRQKLLAEVKITNAPNNLNGDLIKLKMAISNDLNFENAIMIVANKPLLETRNEIIAFLNQQDPQLDQASLRKLHLFHAIPVDGNLINYTFLNFIL